VKVVVYRKSDTHAQGHILARGYDHAFCGDHVPNMLVEQYDDERNPYIGKGSVTCHACLAEFNAGRRSGYRDMERTTLDLETVEKSESAPTVEQ
jgi:hypothetical protein